MEISDYKFNVGDEVITILGEKGSITRICDCEYCKERGFFQPYWENEIGDEEYITEGEAERGFPNYYKIGKYRFQPFSRELVERSIGNHESIVEMLKKRLKVIEELEKEESK